jgi:hypothetical protein
VPPFGVSYILLHLYTEAEHPYTKIRTNYAYNANDIFLTLLVGVFLIVSHLGLLKFEIVCLDILYKSSRLRTSEVFFLLFYGFYIKIHSNTERA